MDATTEQDDIRAALGRVMAGTALDGKAGLKDILAFVVEEDMAGRGERLKAYTIGVDALGRGADFDPSTDSIVRVQVNRLRAALDAHYEGEGAEDPLRISIPKGSYRPAYERRFPDAPVADPGSAPEAVPETEAPETATARRRLPFVPLAAGGALAVAGLAALLVWTSTTDRPSMDHIPVIDVQPFRIEAEEALVPTIRGVREQLIIDLAHLGAVEIHDIESVAPDRDAGPDDHDYDLVGSTSLPGEPPRLLLKLRAVDGEVVWTRTLDLPDDDAEFYALLRDAVGGIAVELADVRGVVTTDVIRRLDLRLERLGDRNASEYECLLLSYTHDTTKDVEAMRNARACLSRLTQSGSDNSAIWAEHALMTFTNAWSATEEEAAAQLQVALAAARQAAQLDPYNAIAHEHLGSILSALARREDAIAAYRRALELAPAKPSLHFQFGWQVVLTGDWEEGMAGVRHGVERSPFAPGWMRIPLALDAFRRGDYVGSLEIARAVHQLGDPRGAALAFAAAAGMDDGEEAARWLAEMRAGDGFDPADPFRAVRRSFSNPSVMADYDRVARESGLL